MIGILGGVFGGISACLFISLLNFAQTLREANPYWIFTLPVAGLLIRFLYLRYSSGFLEGPTLVLSSFISHLGGASTGREGGVIHLSRICAESAGKKLKMEERRIRKFVVVAMGAGFGAALGAPIAGFFFGFEYNRSPFLRVKTLFHSILAGLIAQTIINLSHTPHFHQPSLEFPGFSISAVLFVLLASVLFGLITAVFHLLRKRYEHSVSGLNPLVVGFVGGLLLTILFASRELDQYQGLGGATILSAYQETLPLIVSLKKTILTIISLGSGFQGGEYFPLAFIGTTLGSAISFANPALLSLLVSLGFVSAYGATTQTPIACSILAAEIFGWKILPFAFACIWLAARIHRSLTLPKADPRFDP